MMAGEGDDWKDDRSEDSSRRAKPSRLVLDWIDGDRRDRLGPVGRHHGFEDGVRIESG